MQAYDNHLNIYGDDGEEYEDFDDFFESNCGEDLEPDCDQDESY